MWNFQGVWYMNYHINNILIISDYIMSLCKALDADLINAEIPVPNYLLGWGWRGDSSSPKQKIMLKEWSLILGSYNPSLTEFTQILSLK